MSTEMRFTNPMAEGGGPLAGASSVDVRAFEEFWNEEDAGEATPEKKSKSKSKKKKKAKKRGKADDTLEFGNPLSSDWPMQNGRMKLDTQRSKEMVTSIQKLYSHLRAQAEIAKKAGTRDTFGLGIHLNDSDEDDASDDDGERHEGEIHYDEEALEAQRAAKKLKHALKVGDPMKMPIDDVKAQLEKFGKSQRGDKDALRARLQLAYSQQAEVMQGNKRTVQHFTSAATKRNIEILTMKVNKGRTTAVQEKLKVSHGEIREMQAEIERQRQELADLRAQLEAARQRASWGQPQVTVVREVSQRTTATMAVATKVTGRLLPNWSLWTQADVAAEKARKNTCHVLVLDTASGCSWAAKFAQPHRKTRDGRRVEVSLSFSLSLYLPVPLSLSLSLSLILALSLCPGVPVVMAFDQRDSDVTLWWMRDRRSDLHERQRRHGT